MNPVPSHLPPLPGFPPQPLPVVISLPVNSTTVASPEIESNPEPLPDSVASLVLPSIDLHNSFSPLTLTTDLSITTPQTPQGEEKVNEEDQETVLERVQMLSSLGGKIGVSNVTAGCSNKPAKTKPKITPVVMKKKTQVKKPSGQKVANRPDSGGKKGIASRLRSSKAGPGFSPATAICISVSSESQAVLDTPVVADIATNTDKNKDLRRSLRMQAQGDADSIMSKARKRKAGEGSSSSGIPLISRFPYFRLTIEQVINLFNVYQIRLGNSVDDSHIIISSIRHMDRQHFELVIQQLLQDSKKSQQMVTLGLEQLESVDRNNLDTNSVGRPRQLRLQELD